MEMNNKANHLDVKPSDTVSVDQSMRSSIVNIPNRVVSDAVSEDQSMRSSVINIPNKVKEFWIEKNFSKRQCSCFIRSNSNGDRDRCACGHHKLKHSQDALVAGKSVHVDSPWQTIKHTNEIPTDAFGQIDFQGGSCHATKAQYVRLDHLTSPEKILQLLLHQWTLELPKLLISVHGGIANFDLQPKLKRVFNKGLIKAANTTGAWIITGGTNTGVIRHVGSALAEKSMKKRKKHIVAIGIAPWGVVHRRKDLIGRDKAVNYHAEAHPKNNTAVLNSRHNYFLLADNGTEGKYGADIVLRKELERYISHQRIHIRGEKPRKGPGVPIVCVVLEGGSNTIRTVLDYLTGKPPVPVVVCDGSGRAADLLAFVHKYTNDEGNLPPMLKEQLISTIKKTFSYNDESAARLFYELIMCMKKKHLITVFRMGEQCQDIDLPILTALLTSHHTSASQQLSLALSWDRVDVARSHIFTYGQEWPEGTLEHAMLDALVQNKVDFVELLLEKGVNMNKFLTISTMEELYNTKIGSTSTLYMMLREVRKNKKAHTRVSLLEVGEVLEKLMGGAYRSQYCKRQFKSKYYQATKDKYSPENKHSHKSEECPFPFPFSDLMIWAVLLKRQKMAKFMWRREEEALVKAIVACQLYKSLAREAIDEPLVDNEVSEELTLYAKEFQKLAVDILDHCYKEDVDQANQLLTYELKSFSKQTCISLAHRACMRDFIAHPCCQTLITDMWMGGLRMNKSSVIKVILGILVPFSIITLNFKSKEELQLLPQTEEEHIDELEEGDESSTSSGSQNSLEQIDANRIIQNYAEHPDEVNQLITWGPADSSDQHSEPESNADKNIGPPDASFFNNTTLLKLKQLRKRHQELKLGKKVSEFYKAPVTKFWMHTMAYLIFLCLYNYIVLVKLERYFPSYMELYVIVYVFFHGVEMIRELVVSEPTKFSHKIAIFFSQFWNIMDLLSLPLFWIAVTLRFQSDEMMFLRGRVLYGVNIIFWYLRILELFSVTKNLGPYVVIMGKMMVDMLNFIVILLVILMSFGVARQAIRNPYYEPSWMAVRDIFMEPYFMLYGEVYAPDIDPPCGEGHDVAVCWPLRWITPAIMAAYLLVANILLLNLLIAVFNNTYQRVSKNSREIWMFQRYSLTLEYEIKPLLPAPLIIFSFMYLICKWIRRRCRHSRKIQDYGLKLFMNDEEVRRLHDFEEDCVDDYFNTLEIQFESSTEEQIKATNQRVENIMLKMGDMNQKENQVKLSVQAMEMRIGQLEDLAIENFEQAQRLQYQATMSNGLPTLVSRNSVEQFVIDSASVGTDPSAVLSPPVSRAPLFKSRSRSSSVEDEFSSQRFSLKRTLPDSARSSLLRRRKGKDLKPIKTAGINFGQTAGSTDSQVETAYPAASGLPSIVENLHNTSPGKLSIITQSPDEVTLPNDNTGEDDLARKKLTTVQSLPVPTNHGLSRERESLSLNSSFKSSLPSPRLYSPYSTMGKQSALSTDHGLVTFAPVKSSLRNEYSSITDVIDTSCIHISPVASPTSSFSSSNKFYFGPIMDSGDINRNFPNNASNSAKQFLEQQSEMLKLAEEHETKVLGNSMRRRIRQISIDDSGSMGDLAQHIISELDRTSPNVATECQESSHTDDISPTSPADMLNGHVTTSIDQLSDSNPTD